MTATDPCWVILAQIVRPQGRKGEVLADLLTDFPESFEFRRRLFLQPPQEEHGLTPQAVELESHWFHQGRIVLKFSGIDNISMAETLRNQFLVLPKEERMPLEIGTFYVDDLVGSQLLDVSGGGRKVVGEIIDILPEGIGPAMLLLRTSGPEPSLIPFVKAYLRDVDIEAKQLTMELPSDLLEAQAHPSQKNSSTGTAGADIPPLAAENPSGDSQA